MAGSPDVWRTRRQRRAIGEEAPDAQDTSLASEAEMDAAEEDDDAEFAGQDDDQQHGLEGGIGQAPEQGHDDDHQGDWPRIPTNSAVPDEPAAAADMNVEEEDNAEPAGQDDDQQHGQGLEHDHDPGHGHGHQGEAPRPLSPVRGSQLTRLC